MSGSAGSAAQLLGELRGALVELFHGARDFDIRQFEALSAEQLIAALGTPTRTLLDRTVSVLQRLVEYSDSISEAQAGPNFELSVDDVLRTSTPSSLVGDLAFISLTELRQHQARLSSHRDTGDAWEMMCDCASTLRRIQKSAAALERALSELDGRPPELPYNSELKVSLEVRRQYRKLWRFVEQAGEVGREDVLQRLRQVGTLLAMLVGRDVYPHLREGDRFALRGLQQRIITWLSQQSEETVAGRRIWQDFAAFAEMLRQVNLRPELMEHDAAALERARTMLQKGNDTAGREALEAVLVGETRRSTRCSTASVRPRRCSMGWRACWRGSRCRRRRSSWSGRDRVAVRRGRLGWAVGGPLCRAGHR